MKVLLDAHAITNKRTGIGRYMENLIRYLPPQKVGLSIYTTNSKLNVLREYKNYPLFYFPFKNGLLRVLVGLNLAIIKQKPNLIHVNFFAPFIKSTPLVVTVHDLCFRKHNSLYPLKTRIAFMLFLSRSLKLADRIICVSNTVKNELIKDFNIPKDKITVIYEAPDPVFRKLKDKKQLIKNAQYKFKINKPFLLVVGNVEKRKNSFSTIKAFAQLNSKHHQLVFAGPVIDKDLRTLPLVRRLLKKKVLVFTDFVTDDELNILVNLSEAVIYNSKCEGFGLSIVEAMACRKPVLCSDITVFREIAGGAAYYFNDLRSLEFAMQKLLRDKKLRSELIKKGDARIKRYSWEKTADQTLSVYKKVINDLNKSAK